MQTNLTVGTVAITGTLKYLASGALATDWGAGNFMALKFSTSNWNAFESVKVGLEPSVSSGLADIKSDPDHNGVFKVTGIVQGEQQKFVIDAVSSGGLRSRREYDIRQLVMEDAPAEA